MASESVQKPRPKSIGFGALGGFVAGIVMMFVALGTSTLTPTPIDTIPIVAGSIFGFEDQSNAKVVGIGAHLVTSTAIGVIFGIVVSSVNKLRITTYPKGLAEGVIAGLIGFAVISVPLMLTTFPPEIADVWAGENPDVTEQMAMEQLKENLPVNMAFAVIRHIAYGLVLGVVATFLIKWRASRTQSSS